jgi:hypothetical protein
LTININIIHVVIAAMIAIVVILIILAISKRRQSSEYRIRKILSPITRSKIKNIIIPDGIGGILEIEQLRLLDQGILIIETYPVSGHLFGAEEIDQWTQLVNGRSYKFVNPLRHIRTSRQAVMSLMPNIPVFYRVIFSADTSFPKGMPEGISVVDSLSHDLRPIQSEPKHIEQTQQAWDKLLRVARKNGRSAEVGEKI